MHRRRKWRLCCGLILRWSNRPPSVHISENATCENSTAGEFGGGFNFVDVSATLDGVGVNVERCVAYLGGGIYFSQDDLPSTLQIVGRGDASRQSGAL